MAVNDVLIVVRLCDSNVYRRLAQSTHCADFVYETPSARTLYI